MAQATKSRSRKSASPNGSKPNASAAAGKTQKKRSPAKRSSSNAGRAKSNAGRAKSASSGAAKSRSSSSSARRNGAAALPAAAVERTKSAGHALAEAAAKAKTPLIAGGTAIAGAAAGAAMKARLGRKRSKNPIKRIRQSVPKSAAKLDLKSVQSAAERVSAYGRQASDIAGAMEKSRKKNG